MWGVFLPAGRDMGTFLRAGLSVFRGKLKLQCSCRSDGSYRSHCHCFRFRCCISSFPAAPCLNCHYCTCSFACRCSLAEVPCDGILRGRAAGGRSLPRQQRLSRHCPPPHRPSPACPFHTHPSPSRALPPAKNPPVRRDRLCIFFRARVACVFRLSQTQQHDTGRAAAVALRLLGQEIGDHAKDCS